jgi:hypothetical protein
MKIDRPGVYENFPEAVYHADPCPEPSLSSSIAKEIVNRSPLHAMIKHPRLGTPEIKEPNRTRDIGSAVHVLTLGRGARIVSIDADAYRKDPVKEQRDAAYAAGHIPLLNPDLEAAHEMAKIVRPVILSYLPKGFRPELVLAWQQESIWLRTMVDATDMRVVVDLKTTASECDPESVRRRFNDDANDIQAAFIERGLDALDPGNRGRRRFVFIYQEQAPPYAVTPLLVSEASLTVARHSVDYAVSTWAACLQSGAWPGYGATMSEPTPWMQSRRATNMQANTQRDAAE